MAPITRLESPTRKYVQAPPPRTTTAPESAPQQSTRPGADRYRDSFEAPSARGVNAIEGGKSDAAALRTQRDLSGARQQLGKDQHALEGRERKLAEARRGFNDRTATPAQVKQLTELHKAVNDARKQVESSEKKVSQLEKEEAGQVAASPQAVEKARFQVFTERFAELEKVHGKEKAATLARQTYYNSPAWNAGRGSSPASKADINAAGLPHDPKYVPGLAVSGYSGESRTPDGKQVDLGHVAAAIDWQVNKDKVPSSLNPFNLDTVTLTGDVASAINRVRDGTNAGTSLAAAIKSEGDGDWNGDIDGLNIAKRLANNPGASIGQTLKDYYGTGAYQNRVDEFAKHSKYIQRDANGTPGRTASGAYAVDTQKLAQEAKSFARVLGLGGYVDEGTALGVAKAWEQWLSQNTVHTKPTMSAA
ncbi:hypothetical protein [Myxococcus landrumensis]|uniref:Uncharacterized protein n=1 Tax=Myxococcus landrumensis TaxID=2813577 RepID=A0ABX7N5Y7_9BACT|nr:hypothetical protein [Myxococcus landrumus]QSQ14159.1 hypothetical protein JY572_38600 [Myxococcus landrumus]